MNVKLTQGRKVHKLRGKRRFERMYKTICGCIFDPEFKGEELTDEPVTCRRCLKQPEGLCPDAGAKAPTEVR